MDGDQGLSLKAVVALCDQWYLDYGEKAWQYIFGAGRLAVIVYRMLFLGFIVLGAISSLENVISFSDLMILSMAFPNIIGGVLLAPRVKALLTDYWTRYRNNEFTTYA